MRRMDRYGYGEDNHNSRLDKNQELYQNISNNVIYTNLEEIKNANAFDISQSNNSGHTTREDYQKIQRYKDLEDVPPSKKELDDFNYFYQKKEKKIYDINSVLEEARKNRNNSTLSESKKKLVSAYNILLNSDKKELEKYREEKKKRLLTPEEEEIREIINTIASKTLAGEIDRATSVDLLSDLMATNMLDTVSSSKELSSDDIKEDKDEEIESLDEEDKEDDDKSDEKEEKESDEITDFYSKSLELNNNDLDLSMEFQEKSLPLFLKILIILVILSLIVVAIIFIYNRIK